MIHSHKREGKAMYMNKVSEADFLEGVAADFDEALAVELNERCNSYVEADEARGVVMYSVENYDDREVARREMHAACDILVEGFGLNVKG